MPKAVLSGLKNHPVKISAICAMLDSGGSAGRLRREYKILSPGDIRRSFITLADASPAIKKLFDYRFQSGSLKGHNFANLLLAAIELSTDDYGKVIKTLNHFLNLHHQVLPVTLDKSELYAKLEKGKIIKGETNIDIPKHNPKLKIKEVFLKPEARAYPPTLKAIENSDLIIIGPGDLYSSLAQVLLVKGISEAIKKSKAKKVYISNLMTKNGETNNFTVLDFSKEVEKLLGGELDYVIYNGKIPSAKRLTNYKKQHSELLELVKFDKDLNKKKFIKADILANSKSITHNPKKLSEVILHLE